jgi:ubiquinol-cytochrome c reductase cytochrome c1 subunit
MMKDNDHGHGHVHSASCSHGVDGGKKAGKCYNVPLMGVAILLGLGLLGLFGSLIVMSAKPHQVEGQPDKFAEHPKQQVWSFDGAQGKFDRAAAQRGFQVYKEVCSACHGLKRVAFRSLMDLGFSEAEVKALAKDYTFAALDDSGAVVDRPGIPADHFPSPQPNELAARAANNGAYPPDMSLLVKARHDGANYIYSLITGYHDAPADFPVSEGMHYNPYFEGRQIAMAAPLSADAVTYADGTAATVDQMAHDVVVFLQWASEPETEHRKSMGLRVMIFLAIGTVFFWIAKRRIWKNAK